MEEVLSTTVLDEKQEQQLPPRAKRQPSATTLVSFEPSLAVLWQVLDYALHALVDMLRCRRPAFALVSDSYPVVLGLHGKPAP